MPCVTNMLTDPESGFGKTGFKFNPCCGESTASCGRFCPFFDSMIAAGPAGGAMVFTHPSTWVVSIVGAGVNIFQIVLYATEENGHGDCERLETFYIFGGACGLCFLPVNLVYLLLYWKRPGTLAVQILAILTTCVLLFNIVWWILGNVWIWGASTETKEHCGDLYDHGRIAMIVLDCIPVVAIPLALLLWYGSFRWPKCCTRCMAKRGASRSTHHRNEPAGPQTVRRIGVLYFDGGTAHRIAAHALRDVIEEHHDFQGCTVQLVDAYTEIFKYDDTFCRYIGGGMEAFNDALKYERVSWLGFWLGMARMTHDISLNEMLVRRMSAFFEDNHFDLAISTMPLYNEMMFRALRRICPEAITVVLPVDFKQNLPRYWFSPRSPTDHYIVFNDTLLQQGRKYTPQAQVHRIGGMVLPPQFYLDPLSDEARAAARVELGLPADQPVGLVSFGGQGSMLMLDIAKQLDAVGLDFSMIYVCGRNEEARELISALGTKHAKAVMGFTKEMPRLMSLSDFFIGKPGPTSIHEAIVAGTPAILFKSQGMRYLLGPNEVWFGDTGLGIIIDDIHGLVPATKRVIQDKGFKERIAKEYHRGVFDCAEILVHKVVGQKRLPRRSPPARQPTPPALPISDSPKEEHAVAVLELEPPAGTQQVAGSDQAGHGADEGPPPPPGTIGPPGDAAAGPAQRDAAGPRLP
eukprot:TRINITY_DN4341_c0_g2_i1.p1 TRINITY_DN4341_c0_g2~~TRINITY_DN4341_c0_g2_i1.p1  ORF type:complete len:729 (+),score=229.30 TRINITY_DN4341_c0_g2_i1:117-2189(+)